jgi:hypothetical protein
VQLVCGSCCICCDSAQIHHCPFPEVRNKPMQTSELSRSLSYGGLVESGYLMRSDGPCARQKAKGVFAFAIGKICLTLHGCLRAIFSVSLWQLLKACAGFVVSRQWPYLPKLGRRPSAQLRINTLCFRALSDWYSSNCLHCMSRCAK